MFDLSTLFKGLGGKPGGLMGMLQGQQGQPAPGAPAPPQGQPQDPGGWEQGTTVKPEGALFTQGLDGNIAGLNNQTLGKALMAASGEMGPRRGRSPVGAFARGYERGQDPFVKNAWQRG